MKKVIQYIALSIFVALFVSTSGGLFFFIHQCREHKVTEILFQQRDGGSCCHHDEIACCATAKDRTVHSAHDHSVLENDHSFHCCSTSPVYLKIGFQFFKSSVQKIQLPFQWLSQALLPQQPAVCSDYNAWPISGAACMEFIPPLINPALLSSLRL